MVFDDFGLRNRRFKAEFGLEGAVSEAPGSWKSVRFAVGSLEGDDLWLDVEVKR